MCGRVRIRTMSVYLYTHVTQAHAIYVYTHLHMCSTWPGLAARALLTAALAAPAGCAPIGMTTDSLSETPAPLPRRPTAAWGPGCADLPYRNAPEAHKTL